MNTFNFVCLSINYFHFLLDGLKDNILYESSQSDGLKKNVLYQSAGPDFESQNKTSTSCEYAVVQKPNAIYAEVNKDPQPKKAKAKKQKGLI